MMREQVILADELEQIEKYGATEPPSYDKFLMLKMASYIRYLQKQIESLRTEVDDMDDRNNYKESDR